MADDWAWDDHIPSGVHGMDGYDSVSCSCGWDSETGKLGWVEHIRAMGADSLAAAWSEAEAALPEGAWLRVEYISGSHQAGDGIYVSDGAKDLAAALRALAAKLRERAG